jgi:hypothetical protein
VSDAISLASESTLLRLLKQKAKAGRSRKTIYSKDDSRDAAAMLRRRGHQVVRVGLMRWLVDGEEISSGRLVKFAKRAGA